jgi:hypothetical protein
VALVCASIAGTARAADPAVAQALFEKGRSLMAQGKYPEACQALAESQRREPAGGTLLNLALCHELEGKVASASSEFRDALNQARQDGRADRIKLAGEHLAALEPKVPHLVLKGQAGRSASNLEWKLDGQPIANAASAVPVDPGVHDLSASALGKKPWNQPITIAAGARETVIEVPKLEDEATTKSDPAPPSERAAEPPPASAQTIVATPEPPRAQGEAAATRDTTKRNIGFAVGGAGVVALGVGSYFGLKAFSKWSDRNQHCLAGHCLESAVTDADDANRAATAANVAFVLGLASLGVGTYIVVTSKGPAEPRRTVRVTPDVDARGARLWLGGTW